MTAVIITALVLAAPIAAGAFLTAVAARAAEDDYADIRAKAADAGMSVDEYIAAEEAASESICGGRQ